MSGALTVRLDGSGRVRIDAALCACRPRLRCHRAQGAGDDCRPRLCARLGRHGPPPRLCRHDAVPQRRHALRRPRRIPQPGGARPVPRPGAAESVKPRFFRASRNRDGEALLENAVGLAGERLRAAVGGPSALLRCPRALRPGGPAGPGGGVAGRIRSRPGGGCCCPKNTRLRALQQTFGAGQKPRREASQEPKATDRAARLRTEFSQEQAAKREGGSKPPARRPCAAMSPRKDGRARPPSKCAKLCRSRPSPRGAAATRATY
jgi:hypothetical protein